jgi:hypothetical protein
VRKRYRLTGSPLFYVAGSTSRGCIRVYPRVLWFILVLFLLAAQACSVAAQKEAFSGT